MDELNEDWQFGNRGGGGCEGAQKIGELGRAGSLKGGIPAPPAPMVMFVESSDLVYGNVRFPEVASFL